MSNNFCRYLSNGYNFSTYQSGVVIKPCCYFRGPSVDINGNIQQYFNKVGQITSWTPACEACKQCEDAGQQSLRQAGFDWINEENHNDPVSIDINIDMTCNAACVTCGEYSSSLWYKEKSKYSDHKIDIKISNDSNINTIFDKIVSEFDLSKLKYIKFYGGEPMATDTHIKFLDKIPCPQNVTVHYTTNGSVTPNQRTKEIWEKFRLILFAVSVDGIDQQFDYIRWPLTWIKISENLLNVKQNKIHNVMFRLEFTVNFLNAWYFDTVENWVRDNFSHNAFGDNTEVNLHFCSGGIFNPEFMSEKLRQAILEKYPTDHKIHRLVQNLPVGKSNKFFDFVNVWDERRSNDWRKAFAEIQHLVV